MLATALRQLAKSLEGSVPASSRKGKKAFAAPSQSNTRVRREVKPSSAEKRRNSSSVGPDGLPLRLPPPATFHQSELNRNKVRGFVKGGILVKKTRSRSRIGPKGPVDPKVSTEIAFRLAEILKGIFLKNGPLNAADCWTHAEIAGLKSKSHMKIMLRWMLERKQIKLIGSYKTKKGQEDESFRYALLYYEEKKQAEKPQES